MPAVVISTSGRMRSSWFNAAINAESSLGAKSRCIKINLVDFLRGPLCPTSNTCSYSGRICHPARPERIHLLGFRAEHLQHHNIWNPKTDLRRNAKRPLKSVSAIKNSLCPANSMRVKTRHPAALARPAGLSQTSSFLLDTKPRDRQMAATQ
jgi:hypothetical protein